MKQQKINTGERMMQKLTYLFAAWMAGIYPLFFRNNYIDILRAKLAFIRTSSLIFIGMVLIIGIVRMTVWKEVLRPERKVVPELLFTGLLLTGAGTGAILSGNFTESFWGNSGRRFGMFVLLLCILLYVIIGKYFRADTGFI